MLKPMKVLEIWVTVLDVQCQSAGWLYFASVPTFANPLSAQRLRAAGEHRGGEVCPGYGEPFPWATTVGFPETCHPPCRVNLWDLERNGNYTVHQKKAFYGFKDRK